MSSIVIYGDTSGATTVAANATAGTNTLTLPTNTGRLAMDTTLSFKNRFINGAMMIDQRNAGASISANDYSFAVDRWSYYAYQNGKGTIQQNQGSVTPPAGFVNYLGFTSSSAYSVPSGEAFFFNQRIEGYNIADLAWGTNSAKTVTLSFWVYSSLTGTFGGSIRNSAGNRSYPYSYSIPVANTWTFISVVIPGDTTGTWLTTNGIGAYVTFGLGVGSTFSGTANTWAAANYWAPTGATSIVGTNGATFYITGVQLEVGSQATSFDYRSYGTELGLCQRYYQKLGGVSYAAIGSGFLSSATNFSNGYVKFTTTMRTSPTITFSNLVVTDRIGYENTVSTFTASTAVGTDSLWYNLSCSSGGTAYYPNALVVANGTTGYLALSAEL